MEAVAGCQALQGASGGSWRVVAPSPPRPRARPQRLEATIQAASIRVKTPQLTDVRCRCVFLWTALLSTVWCPMVDAQEGGFDLLSGETLFHQGSGITGSHVYSSRRGVDDHSFVAGMSYGVVPWLTASALLPWIHRNVDAESSQGADLDFSLEGVGDVDLLAAAQRDARFCASRGKHATTPSTRWKVSPRSPSSPRWTCRPIGWLPFLVS